jgi:hypothetical protein
MHPSMMGMAMLGFHPSLRPQRLAFGEWSRFGWGSEPFIEVPQSSCSLGCNPSMMGMAMRGFHPSLRPQRLASGEWSRFGWGSEPFIEVP